MVVTRTELALDIELGITRQLDNLAKRLGAMDLDQLELGDAVQEFRSALGNTIAQAIIKAIQEGVAS